MPYNKAFEVDIQNSTLHILQPHLCSIIVVVRMYQCYIWDRLLKIQTYAYFMF